MISLVILGLVSFWNSACDFPPAKEAILVPPTFTHLLGTNNLGQDVFYQTLCSLQLAYWSGFVATFITAVGGITLGFLAGYFGRCTDVFLLRFADFCLSMPHLLLILLVVFSLKTILPGKSHETAVVMIAFGFAGIPSCLRLVRDLVLYEKKQPYIEASHALGTASWQIASWHISRNISPFLTTFLANTFASTIWTASALGFLGLGASDTATLGRLLYKGQEHFTHGYWWVISGPILVLWLTLLGANLLSDGLNEKIER